MSKKDRDKVWFFEFAALRASIQALKTTASKGDDIKYRLIDVIDKMETALTALGQVVEVLNVDVDKLETQSSGPPHRR